MRTQRFSAIGNRMVFYQLSEGEDLIDISLRVGKPTLTLLSLLFKILSQFAQEEGANKLKIH